jgi:hypothetical protein
VGRVERAQCYATEINISFSLTQNSNNVFDNKIVLKDVFMTLIMLHVGLNVSKTLYI